ncbi:MAG TPA: hypothetical protein PKD83_03225, partial [Ignavibacteria bacterium]|nr:hypothetical protein [Ignavibacteria bacterium]
MKTQSEQKQIVSFNGSNIKTNGKSSNQSNGALKKSAWEYSKSLEDSKHIKLKSEYDLFIGGKWLKSKKYF